MSRKGIKYALLKQNFFFGCTNDFLHDINGVILKYVIRGTCELWCLSVFKSIYFLKIIYFLNCFRLPWKAKPEPKNLSSSKFFSWIWVFLFPMWTKVKWQKCNYRKKKNPHLIILLIWRKFKTWNLYFILSLFKA